MSRAFARSLVLVLLLSVVSPLQTVPTAHAAASAPKSVPAKLFPSAVEVRLFAWTFKKVGERYRQAELAPDGVALTLAEVAVLRQSVTFGPEPEWVAACCIPRHTFKFYDAKKKEIGELKMCFECYCAHITGENPPSPELTWVDWDMRALGRIVTAHGLPPK